MSDKTKVTIEMTDGTKRGLTGDTVILFAVDQAEEFLNGRVKAVNAQVVSAGRTIPVPIFAATIGSLVGNYLETSPNSGGKVMASYNLHEVAKILETKSEALRKQVTPQEVDDSMQDALKNLFEALRR